MRLAIHNLDKRLGTREVLRGISLSMQADEVLVILGPNGSGKSTLLRLVAGIWEPDGGRIEVDGNPLSDGRLQARRLLGYVPDSADPLPDLLVEELISLVSKLKQAPLPAPALIDQLGVTPYLGQRLGSLSFGQRKRACLLSALIGNPVLLLLDEPSNGLDPEGVAMVIELIKSRKQEGLATLLATNDKPFAAGLPGRCLRIESGQLIAATP